MRARKTVPLAMTVAALAAAGVASAAVTGSYRDGPLTATFSASTRHPNCKQKWPVTVSARYNGKPAHATAIYQFLYDGQLVNTQYPYSSTAKNPHGHIWHFTGGFTDPTFGPFGSLAVGQHLTVRAVIKDGRYTAYPSLAVSVVSVPGCKALR
jgi:hypothetical protein